MEPKFLTVNETSIPIPPFTFTLLYFMLKIKIFIGKYQDFYSIL